MNGATSRATAQIVELRKLCTGTSMSARGMCFHVLNETTRASLANSERGGIDLPWLYVHSRRVVTQGIHMRYTQ